MKTIKRQFIEESDIGVYVWEMPDGRWVGDDDGNFLSIAAKKGDPRRLKELTDAVHSFNVATGKPLFLAGHRKVSDEEFERQRERMESGLVPDDQYDIPSLIEDMKYREQFGG